MNISSSEKAFENAVKRYFHSIGILPASIINDNAIGWYSKIWVGGFQKAGIPDILACVNGIFVAVELKAERGRLSQIQKLNLQKIDKSGGIAVVLYPSGFEDFKKLIKELIKCNSLTVELRHLKNVNSCTSLNIYKN